MGKATTEKFSDEVKVLMSSKYKITVCTPYDSAGTVRTGKEWFNRYMLYPWERSRDFELVVNKYMNL